MTAERLQKILAAAGVASRRAAPWLAILALIGTVALLLNDSPRTSGDPSPWSDVVRVGDFARYIKLITCAVGALLVLLAWPTNADATGSSAHDFGTESGQRSFAARWHGSDSFQFATHANHQRSGNRSGRSARRDSNY